MLPTQTDTKYLVWNGAKIINFSGPISYNLSLTTESYFILIREFNCKKNKNDRKYKILADRGYFFRANKSGR